MLLILWIVLILLGFVFKKSKTITAVQILYAALMLAYNNGNPDQWSYFNKFVLINESFKNVSDGNLIFNLLLYIFGVFHHYNVAVLFMAGLSFFLMYKGILFYTDLTALVVSFYLLSPFIIDGTQLKNFIAMAVWIYFSKYLYMASIREKCSRNLLFYIIGVMIATGIHFSFLFMFAYLIIIYINQFNLKNFIFFLSIFGCVCWALNNVSVLLDLISDRNISVLRLILKKIDDYAINYNAISTTTRNKITIYFFIIIMLILFLSRIFIKYSKNYHEKIKILKFVEKITLVSTLLFPLMTFSKEIYRMQRDLFVIYYILIAKLIDGAVFNIQTRKIIVKRIVPYIFGLILSGLYLLADCIIWNYESVFKVFFKIP